MLKKAIVPELLQEKCTPQNIVNHITKLLKRETLYQKQMQGFEDVKQYLSNGEQTPSENAADEILRLIKC